MVKCVFPFRLCPMSDCVSCADEGSVRDYECACDGPSCDGGDRCFGQQCFSALSVQNAISVQQKGCIVGRSEESISCESPPSHNPTVECCHGDLCNMNVTVATPARGDTFILTGFITLMLLSRPQRRLSTSNVLTHKHFYYRYRPT